MLIDDYLELVQLTELYLLQNIPRKTGFKAAKAELPPLPKVQEMQPLPKIIPAKEPAPQVPKEAPPVIEPVYQSVNDILELLKVHCPKLKLIAPLDNRKTVYILFDQESPLEKMLLENICKAIRKEGFSSELLDVKMINEEHLQKHAALLLGARSAFASQALFKQHAKRHPTGKLHIDKAEALVIPSLENLIEDPGKKRALWNDILAALKG